MALNAQASGVYTIAATPFHPDGRLDIESIDRMTDFYLKCGVTGMTILGIMGEAPKLTPEESLSVVDRVIRRAQGRQVIVGVSHAGLENVRRLSHEVMVAGASGVMVAPPIGLKGDDGVYNYFAQLFKELGPDKFQIVVPSVSILAEPPVTYVDKVIDKRGTREVAKAYVEYLYSPEGQKIAGENYYRPIDPKTAAQFDKLFPKINLFTIDEVFGGWAKAQKTHFNDGGVFDTIYAKK